LNIWRVRKKVFNNGTIQIVSEPVSILMWEEFPRNRSKTREYYKQYDDYFKTELEADSYIEKTQRKYEEAGCDLS